MFGVRGLGQGMAVEYLYSVQALRMASQLHWQESKKSLRCQMETTLNFGHTSEGQYCTFRDGLAGLLNCSNVSARRRTSSLTVTLPQCHQRVPYR